MTMTSYRTDQYKVRKSYRSKQHGHPEDSEQGRRAGPRNHPSRGLLPGGARQQLNISRE